MHRSSHTKNFIPINDGEAFSAKNEKIIKSLEELNQDFVEKESEILKNLPSIYSKAIEAQDKELCRYVKKIQKDLKDYIKAVKSLQNFNKEIEETSRNFETNKKVEEAAKVKAKAANKEAKSAANAKAIAEAKIEIKKEEIAKAKAAVTKAKEEAAEKVVEAEAFSTSTSTFIAASLSSALGLSAISASSVWAFGDVASVSAISASSALALAATFSASLTFALSLAEKVKAEEAKVAVKAKKEEKVKVENEMKKIKKTAEKAKQKAKEAMREAVKANEKVAEAKLKVNEAKVSAKQAKARVQKAKKSKENTKNAISEAVHKLEIEKKTLEESKIVEVEEEDNAIAEEDKTKVEVKTRAEVKEFDFDATFEGKNITREDLADLSDLNAKRNVVIIGSLSSFIASLFFNDDSFIAKSLPINDIDLVIRYDKDNYDKNAIKNLLKIEGFEEKIETHFYISNKKTRENRIEFDLTVETESYERQYFLLDHFCYVEMIEEKDIQPNDKVVVIEGKFYFRLGIKKGYENIAENAFKLNEFIFMPPNDKFKDYCYILFKYSVKQSYFKEINFYKKTRYDNFISFHHLFKKQLLRKFFLEKFENCKNSYKKNAKALGSCYDDMKNFVSKGIPKGKETFAFPFIKEFYFALIKSKASASLGINDNTISKLAEQCAHSFIKNLVYEKENTLTHNSKVDNSDWHDKVNNIAYINLCDWQQEKLTLQEQCLTVEQGLKQQEIIIQNLKFQELLQKLFKPQQELDKYEQLQLDLEQNRQELDKDIKILDEIEEKLGVLLQKPKLPTQIPGQHSPQLLRQQQIPGSIQTSRSVQKPRKQSPQTPRLFQIQAQQQSDKSPIYTNDSNIAQSTTTKKIQNLSSNKFNSGH